MEAGVTAGYFNALEKNFPITIATDRVASPIGHKLLIRPDLKDKIKTIADLKGKTDRHQRDGIGHQLRDRPDPGERRAQLQGHRARRCCRFRR